MVALVANNAIGNLANAINNSQTSIALTSGPEGKFPNPTGGDWFPLTVIDGAGNYEIMRCTARSGVTLTVVRAQEGTTARSFSADVRAELRLTAGAIADFAVNANNIGSGTLAEARLPAFITDQSTDVRTLLAAANFAAFRTSLSVKTDSENDTRYAQLAGENSFLGVNNFRNSDNYVGNLAGNGAVTLHIGKDRTASGQARVDFYTNGAAPGAITGRVFMTGGAAGYLGIFNYGTGGIQLDPQNGGLVTVNGNLIRDVSNTPDGSNALAIAGTDTVKRPWDATDLKASVEAHSKGMEYIGSWEHSVDDPVAAVFTDLEEYISLQIIFENITADATTPLLQLSNNNGASFATSGYTSRADDDNGGPTTETSGIRTFRSDGTSFDHGVFEVFGLNVAAIKTNATGIMGGNVTMGGRYETARVDNAIRIITNNASDDFTGGKIHLIGTKG